MKKNVFLFVNKTKEKAYNISEEIKRSLINANYNIVDSINEDADIVIAFGGDGTILTLLSATNYSITNFKYIGINCGTIGFLQDFDITDAQDFVNLIPTLVEERLKLADITILVDNKSYSFKALNEFVIKRNDEKPFRANVYIDATLLENYVGTGLIFSTPTGSTARNLSSGGSILCPGINAIQITPIEANKFFRAIGSSIVVPSNSYITLSPNQKDDVIKVLCDGNEVYTGNFRSIYIHLSNRYLTKLTNHNANFINKIHQKLI